MVSLILSIKKLANQQKNIRILHRTEKLVDSLVDSPIRLTLRALAIIFIIYLVSGDLVKSLILSNQNFTEKLVNLLVNTSFDLMLLSLVVIAILYDLYGSKEKADATGISVLYRANLKKSLKYTRMSFFMFLASWISSLDLLLLSHLWQSEGEILAIIFSIVFGTFGFIFLVLSVVVSMKLDED